MIFFLTIKKYTFGEIRFAKYTSLCSVKHRPKMSAEAMKF